MPAPSTAQLADSARLSLAFDLLREIADRARANDGHPTTAATGRDADQPAIQPPVPTDGRRTP